jgi:hypothetical protein
LYHGSEFGAAGGGAVSLRAKAAPLGPAPFPIRSRLAAVRSLQLVTDLGDGIGSRVWLRGTATCLALCYAAWSFAPGMEPLIGASPAPIAEENWHELQALTISPLAYGADTGRRMAPTDAVQPMLDAPDRPSVELTAMMSFGDSFTRVLERAGVTSAEAAQVAAMVAAVSDPDAIKPGTVMT